MKTMLKENYRTNRKSIRLPRVAVWRLRETPAVFVRRFQLLKL